MPIYGARMPVSSEFLSAFNEYYANYLKNGNSAYLGLTRGDRDYSQISEYLNAIGGLISHDPNIEGLNEQSIITTLSLTANRYYVEDPFFSSCTITLIRTYSPPNLVVEFQQYRNIQLDDNGFIKAQIQFQMICDKLTKDIEALQRQLETQYLAVEIARLPEEISSTTMIEPPPNAPPPPPSRQSSTSQAPQKNSRLFTHKSSAKNGLRIDGDILSTALSQLKKTTIDEASKKVVPQPQTKQDEITQALLRAMQARHKAFSTPADPHSDRDETLPFN